jgi:hypothetical protein
MYYYNQQHTMMFYFNPNIFPDLDEAKYKFSADIKTDKKNMDRMLENVDNSNDIRDLITIKRTELSKITMKNNGYFYINSESKLSKLTDEDLPKNAKSSKYMTQFLKDIKYGLTKVKGEVNLSFGKKSPIIISKPSNGNRGFDCIILIAPYITFDEE